MPSRYWAERLGSAVLIVVIAVAGTFLLYGQTRDYGFDYDDYHFIRPYSSAEIRSAFHGPWDSTGIEVPFYRPLTIAFFAARFELFGLNARAHHTVSLILFACAASLAGLIAWRLLDRWAGGLLTTALFVAHPAMPYAQVAWVTNQMHLIESLVVLSAMLWWTVVRARRVVWWLPLLGFATAAFLIKEDGIMLIPAIVVMHALRRRLVEPTLPPVPRMFLIGAGCVLAALLLLRGNALEGRLGGYRRPTAARAWQNYSKGLNGVLRLVPADRDWQRIASAFATFLPLVALFHVRRASPSSRYGLACGAALAALFNLPFVFVSKAEQLHLVSFAAVLLLAGAAAMVVTSWPQRFVRGLTVLAVSAGVAPLGAVAKDISTDFHPRGPIVRWHDSIVKDWAAVPEELRRYIKEKLNAQPGQRIAPNPIDAIPIVGFGFHPLERSPAGMEYRWMSGPKAEMHVTPSVRTLVMPFRHEAGVFRDPAVVHITADDRTIESLTVRDAEWRVTRVSLAALDTPLFRRFHRVIITLDHAWVPAVLIPGSNDHRTLGLQIGTPQLR